MIRKSLDFLRKIALLHTNLESYAKVLRFEKPTGFAGRRFRHFNARKSYPFILFKNRRLEIRSKIDSKEPRFHQNRVKNQFKKIKRKTAVFFNFRFLDYLSSTLSVGYIYLMNCVDITLLCVFKKSLSNIYVAFFFE